MKRINLMSYQLAVSCGVGQGFFSCILNASRDRMKIKCCGLLLSYHSFDDRFTELMCNS